MTRRKPKRLRKRTETVEQPAPPRPERAGQIEWPALAEPALYAAIFVAAVILRLWGLGGYPLSGEEAKQALAAVDLYRGQTPVGPYSPLLLSLNGLAFLLFGLNESAARLAPLLLGSGLVLLPWTLRRQLGRGVCLATAALLAFSPTAIFLSRTLNSEIAVALASLMLLSGFVNWIESEDEGQAWLWLMAGGLALLLTAGPMAYSILLLFGLMALAHLSTLREMWADMMAEPESEENDLLSPDGEDESLPWRSAALFFGAATLLLATAALFNLSGLGQMAGLFVEWLGHFGLQTRPEAGFNAVFLLTVYEPLLVIAGLVGLILAALRRDALHLWLAGWFVGLLALDLLMGGRPTGHVILPLVPLAFLAAEALVGLARQTIREATWSNEGVLVVAGLVIAAFGYIGLTGWLIRDCGVEDRLCELGWIQPVAALALFLIVALFFGLMGYMRAAWRGAGLTGVAVGLLLMVGIGWRLNYGPLSGLAYQPLAGIPPSAQLVEMTDTLQRQALIRVDDVRLMETTVVGEPPPALAWQLRHYRYLNRVDSLFGRAATHAVITPFAFNEGLELGQAYIGQDFMVDTLWSPVGLSTKQFIEWFIYREINELPPGNRVILWLRVDSQ